VQSRRQSDGEQREKHSLHLAGEQETVEHHEIDVNRIEHQLKRNEDGNHVSAGYETVNTAAKHEKARN
jgi:hypothetical protein